MDREVLNWVVTAPKRDQEFKVAWEEAIQNHVESLEAEADRRAYHGLDHPVIHQGKITAHYKEYSDLLLMFRLKALAPENYRENTRVDGGVRSATLPLRWSTQSVCPSWKREVKETDLTQSLPPRSGLVQDFGERWAGITVGDAAALAARPVRPVVGRHLFAVHHRIRRGYRRCS